MAVLMPHVFLTFTCNPEWPEIQSQLINGQTAFYPPDVTVPVFKSRLDKFKTNIRNGKYFELREVIYIIHVIEYQDHGLPHSHMVFCLDNAHDIDTNNQEHFIDFCKGQHEGKELKCIQSKSMILMMR